MHSCYNTSVDTFHCNNICHRPTAYLVMLQSKVSHMQVPISVLKIQTMSSEIKILPWKCHCEVKWFSWSNVLSSDPEWSSPPSHGLYYDRLVPGLTDRRIRHQWGAILREKLQ